MSARYLFLMGFLVVTSSVTASEIYVNNVVGRDSDDGVTPTGREGNAGPVQSLKRAIQLARFGDIIILANTGTPYYDSISLTGSRNSGTAYTPFMIQGNGSTISGLRRLPPGSWRRESRSLWKVTLTRKGFYRLLRDGKPLPESIPESGLDPRPHLQPGHWAAWQGSLYFRQDRPELPEDELFTYAADQTGISLHQVSNVVISDVKIEHFRFDGIHAQGLCDGIKLDNVVAVENGRAGVVSSGASRIEIFGGQIRRNGRHQLLILDRSKATPYESDIEESVPMAPQPAVGRRINGEVKMTLRP
ncbi:right-handed parallel beta-helix repeat-containing protein [Schlesneria sp. DSM 10557]|uniref:right-handed parallel beta-helix repeat-containing protein n=1 Tax=Schlesneria sp. DSM 10557 TaxID=3044399 RepID=UPI0035A18650